MSEHHQATIFIQARLSSSRLPGKVLLDLAGMPALLRQVRRARRACCAGQVVVLTTSDPSDDPLEVFCLKHGLPYFRGSLHDVLDRYTQAARLFGAETIVRLTADCPAIDPGEIDHVVAEFEASGADFACNRLPPPFTRSYPIGLDTEVIHARGLEQAWREASKPYQREHVMPFFYDEPGRFKVLQLHHQPDYGKLRWTLDTPEDYAVLRRIFEHFGGHDDFSWLEVLDFCQRDAAARANTGAHHKSYFDVDERAWKKTEIN